MFNGNTNAIKNKVRITSQSLTVLYCNNPLVYTGPRQNGCRDQWFIVTRVEPYSSSGASVPFGYDYHNLYHREKGFIHSGRGKKWVWVGKERPGCVLAEENKTYVHQVLHMNIRSGKVVKLMLVIVTVYSLL